MVYNVNMNNLIYFSRENSCLKLKSSFEILCKSLHKAVPQVKNEIPTVTVENQYDILSQIVTPWWHLDYAEQLLRKKKWTRELVERIKSNKIPRCKTKIHDIIASPVIESYRNKDEFSIRTGIDGNDKTVGFFIGSPAEGNVVCVQPIKLISLKESHILLSETFQQLIRDSPLKACHDLHDGGYWKNFVVRSNRKGEIMAMVMVHPSGASEMAAEDSKELIKKGLLSTGVNITSLYYQACPHVKCTNDQAPFILLHGEKYLYETVNGITIRVSPDSFMQVNTDASEELYEAVLSFANISDKTTILDLCSGTGITSLMASSHARGCVGIESVPSAVQDAIFNAEYNNITNCHFVAERIEKKLMSVIKELDLASEIVPIINPGRDGVNQKVISVLRRSTRVRRVVYISCKADSKNTLKNYHDLCSLSFHKSSPPFVLSDVQPIDMFPQTDHCELILVFNR